ncbi:MAG: HAMP domain-containing sensor histidine kinase [Pseudomonadota bacterium]
MSKLTQNWSTATRITLSNAGVILICFLILAGGIMAMSQYFMRQHIQESVRAELNILQSEYQLDGIAGVGELIEARIRERSSLDERMYYLEDAHGQRLAGNLPAWPSAAKKSGEFLTLPSPRDHDDYSVIAQSRALPQGHRIFVGFDERELSYVQRKIRQGATWSLLLVLMLSWLAGRYTTRLALRPIEQIRHSARKIMHGDLQHRIPTRSNGDEFDSLASTLNDMLDRISQLITGLRGATDNIAHDLRSPLTRHRARLESRLSDAPSRDEWTPWVEENLRDIDQVLATFQSLLKIANIDSGLLREAFQGIDLTPLISDAVDFMEPLAEARQQHLSMTLPVSAELLGHRDLLFQLLINLLDNAVKFTPIGGHISITLTQQSDFWCIEVSDTGPGIPESARRKVFDRLYRLDATRQTPGLGLGLSLVQAVTHLHQGRIVLQAAPTEHLQTGHEGLRVSVFLPQQ